MNERHRTASGFLIAGLAGPGNPGYLFVPVESLSPDGSCLLDPYALGRAYGQRAAWLPRPGLEPVDQPLRFVDRVPAEGIAEAEEAVIVEVRFQPPGRLTPHVKVVAQRSDPRRKIVAGVYGAPEGLAGIEAGTLLEVYPEFEAVDARPWALREAVSKTGP